MSEKNRTSRTYGIQLIGGRHQQNWSPSGIRRAA